MAWGFWATYLERLAIVALILAGLYVIAGKLRQTRLFARAGRRMSVLESMMLSQHAAVHVVRVGRRYFLIGSGTGGISALAEFAESDVDGYTLK